MELLKNVFNKELLLSFNQVTDLFDVEKDASFHSGIGQIYQTRDGKDLCPGIEEKAAMLLYLVVKNHSFVDGNKRISCGPHADDCRKPHGRNGHDGEVVVSLINRKNYVFDMRKYIGLELKPTPHDRFCSNRF